MTKLWMEEVHEVIAWMGEAQDVLMAKLWPVCKVHGTGKVGAYRQAFQRM